ncbi:hypothetical protein P4388_21085 [Bacillus thuringiensis]|uniref:hypothetical protein n=1 Tax=Bacillus thuringiensis TaxID=1428 RepID=UPI000A3A7755|nr:hypothetical protein [Bacillus thuringiensis]MED3351094.1 hypothetical protein [Bacillus thuringiensis]MRB10401.1 hypothetical protein [Bacillus thuringiensis]OTW92737.1 hypothetical protein BK711_25590 [Bacillus thuringiensis serovar fukuokaensis]
MIQLKISDEILAKHEEFVFGANSKNENRIYQKVFKAYQNEYDRYAKNVYKFILNNFKDIILGDIQTLTQLKKVYSYLINSIPNPNTRYKC